MTLDPKAVALFLLLVFPGLVSTTIYRLIMPARAMDWGNALVQGLFYSAVNFALSLVIVLPLFLGYDPLQHPIRYALAGVLVLLVLPIVWPVILVKIFKSKKLASRIQIPYPTAWDFFFDQRTPVFLLVHLNGGALIGGYRGTSSYAASFPNDGDIYLEAVYPVDSTGKFGSPIPDTRGILLRKDQYSYIELFSVPTNDAGTNVDTE
jgi:tryptophan-rich sensory protein